MEKKHTKEIRLLMATAGSSACRLFDISRVNSYIWILGIGCAKTGFPACHNTDNPTCYIQVFFKKGLFDPCLGAYNMSAYGTLIYDQFLK